ncbi:hypothetical protein D9M70_585680 [compost metagenome]
MIHSQRVGASMRAPGASKAAGSVPRHPGGVTTKARAAVPVRRWPRWAKGLVKKSSRPST